MDTASPSVAACLVPPLPHLRLQQVTLLANHLIIRLASTAPSARCPRCATSNTSVHSHYTRSLADLPCGSVTVQLRLAVRKFRCSCPTCPQRIFSERLSALAAPYARQTARRLAVQRALGLALGGRAATRLARTLRLPASRTTFLRLVRQTPLPAYAPPRVIGLDDWAFRRGHRYGTIIVDLERHQPIALLPDRQPDTVVAWLQRHPTIQVVTRDRAGGYADAVRRGAPQAQQVADRWHLLKNLVEALERFFLNKRKVLKAAVTEPPPPTPTTQPAAVASLPALPSTDETSAAPPLTAPDLNPPPPVEAARAVNPVRQQRHTLYLERYAQIHALRALGWEETRIAGEVGVSRTTVRRYLYMKEPPAPKQAARRGSRLLRPYEAYLLRRWAEGCRNAKQLWREIAAQGYAYSSHTVERFVGRLRQASGTARSFRRAAPIPLEQRPQLAPAPEPYTPRQAAGLVLARPQHRSRWQRAYLARLCAADEEIARVVAHAEEFAGLVRRREGERLDGWLAAVAAQGVAEIQRFAAGLQADYAAVQTGLREMWSNGQTEGQVHRLKLLKRQMYGRASFAVLRQRVLQRDGPADRDWGEPLSYSSLVIPQPEPRGVRKDRKRLEYRC